MTSRTLELAKERESMVQRVAREVMVAGGGKCAVVDWDEAEWNSALNQAKAAIKAMRDPSKTMSIAHVEYLDGSLTDEMRGYQEAIYRDGVVQFIWNEETLTIPIHRVKCVVETQEKEPEKKAAGLKAPA